MSNMIVDPLPAGAMTWGGKTHGPAINMGRLRPHMVGGRLFYLHLDELRDAVVKAGWHTEADYQQLRVECEGVKTSLELAMDYAAEQADKIEALEKALGWKPTGETTNGDGTDRERELQEGRAAPVARSSAGAKDPSGKDGSGKGRKVRAARSQTG